MNNRRNKTNEEAAVNKQTNRRVGRLVARSYPHRLNRASQESEIQSDTYLSWNYFKT